MPEKTDRTQDPAASLSALHEHILAGSSEAVDRIAERLLPMLQRRLRCSFRHAAEDILVDAVDDAILEYVLRPGRFDPTRGVPLDHFLHAAAWRNTVNLLQGEKKRKAREARYAASREWQTAALQPDVAPAGDRDDWRRLVADTLDERERSAFRLWFGGERRTAIFAALLGWSDLPPDEQRKKVKRFKDRLSKKLSRHLRAHGHVAGTPAWPIPGVAVDESNFVDRVGIHG